MGRASGIDDETLADLPRYQASERFTPREKLALDLAVAMTSTPITVTDELRDALGREFSPAEMAELASAIAWENHRARLNRALGVRAVGFSDGAFCLLPEGSTTV